MYENTRNQLGKSGSTEKSELFKRLTAEEQADVTAFLSWLLETEQVAKGSISSYKSYVCNGILKDDGRIKEELKRSERSGMKKFLHWLDNVKK